MLKCPYYLRQSTDSKQSWEKNTARAITLSHFKTYYTATVIQTAECWHKTRYIDQWNKNDSPEINPHIYGQLIYNKGARNIQWKMKSLSDKFWENWPAIRERVKLDHYLKPHTKINSKWIRDLNSRDKTYPQKSPKWGTSLAIQWLRLRAPNAGGMGWISG